MKCPKCKSDIKENQIRCENCGTKVKAKCPNCGAINHITSLSCQACKKELIKRCPECSAYNLADANDCRKCGYLFVKETNEVKEETGHEPAYEAPAEEEEPLETPKIEQEPALEEGMSGKEVDDWTTSVTPAAGEGTKQEEAPVTEELPHNLKEQLDAKNLIVKGILGQERLILSLIAPEGSGKSLVLKYVYQDISQKGYNWYMAEITPISQISPFGMIVDMLITYLNYPNYVVTVAESKKEAAPFFESHFKLTKSEAETLFDIIFPNKTAYYEKILYNREKSKSVLKKVLYSLRDAKEKSVFVIDDFDIIDASSFDIITELAREGYFNENCKLVLSSQSAKNIDGLIAFAKFNEEQYEKHYLAQLTEENTDELISQLLSGQNVLPDIVKRQIINNSIGNSAYIEQVLIFMNEIGAFNFSDGQLKFTQDENTFEVPPDLTSILNKRLVNLDKALNTVYKGLIYASVLGLKFNSTMLQAVLNLDDTNFDNVIQFLVNSSYIVKLTQDSYIFKNTVIWRQVFEHAKKDPNYAQYNQDLFNVLGQLKLTNTAYRALFAQNSGNLTDAFTNWTDVGKYCCAVGDAHLYVIAQKQCLKLLEKIINENKDVIDTNIKTRLGKLIYTSEPETAFEYLTNVLNIDLGKNDVTDFIDLSSNAIISAGEIENFNAIVEIVDNVVSLLDSEKYKLEIALIKTRKIKTLLHLGNFEELTNIILHDINPFLEDALSQNYTVYNLPISSIFETWIETNLVLAYAYILQGNDKANVVISTLNEAMDSADIPIIYRLKTDLAKGYIHCLKGEIQQTEEILDYIMSVDIDFELPGEFVSRYNLLRIAARFFKGNIDDIKQQLFEVVEYANNNKDYLAKNLVKTALGKVFESDGDYNKAFEIYSSQITYFAKEKIALGALLTWFFIADLYVKIGETEKAAEVTQKALEVSKTPKINSYYFQVLYKKIMAEVYMVKGDFEAVKMYLEKALLITRKFDLKFLSMYLYSVYAKYYFELYKKVETSNPSILVNAKSMHEKSIETALELGLETHIKTFKGEKQALITFCQLNNITI